jgi:hypothetical protein
MWCFYQVCNLLCSINKKTRLLRIRSWFTQKEGKDYFDTYSPVATMTTIRVLAALAACSDLVIDQMDVKTTVLNGELDEIYMKQPDGFVTPEQGNKVCRLRKSLYGLKLAPKQWHEKFDRTLTSVGLVVNEADTFVCYQFGGGTEVILFLYVDGILNFVCGWLSCMTI